MSKKCSLVIPVYKNELFVAKLFERLHAFNVALDDELEVLFIIDGSPDRSQFLIKNAASVASFDSKVVTLQRNYGAFNAIRAGLSLASGEVCAVMSADLQEPDTLILEIFNALLLGESEIAVGTRTTRNDPKISKMRSNAVWFILRKITNENIPVGGVDVFGCSSRIAKLLANLQETSTSLIGQLYWIGGDIKEIPYSRLSREFGKSSWSVRKKIKYLSDSIFSFTNLPIVALHAIGAVGIILSALVGINIIYSRAVGKIVTPGYSSIILAILFATSLIISALGILGSYVSRIYENSKMRPLSIVASVEKFNGRDFS